MTVSSYHAQVCMEAWLNCENLLINLFQKKLSYSDRTKRVINECADICLTAIQAIKKKCSNISDLAILCVGICEECAEVCERYNDTLFQNCASICRECSNAFLPLITIKE